jgi:hypothetical protein
MNADPSQLLRMLEPAVRPISAPTAAGAPRPPVETQSFDALLTLATEGAVRSGRDVSVEAPDAPEMDPAQMDRLSLAADRAEAAGARRALVLMDGAAYLLDVAGRVVTENLAAAPSSSVTAIDHAVVVPGAAESGQSAGGPVLPTAMMPPSLMTGGEQVARGAARNPVDSTSAAPPAARETAHEAA